MTCLPFGDNSRNNDLDVNIVRETTMSVHSLEQAIEFINDDERWK